MDLSLPTAVISATIGSSILLLALVGLNASLQEVRAIRWWIAGASLNALRYAVIYWNFSAQSPVALFAAETMQVMASILLTAGSLIFFGHRVSIPVVYAVSAAVVVWAFYTTIMEPVFLLRTVPLYLLSGAALVWGGALFVKEWRSVRAPGYLITGALFILWGLHRMDYPWVRPIEWMAPYGFMTSMTLYMGLIVSLIMVAQSRLLFLAQQEMSERQRADGALRRNESLMTSVFDNLPVGLVIKDRSQVVERINDMHKKWYGTPEDTASGHPTYKIADFQTPEDIETMTAQEREVLKTGVKLNRLVSRILADGEEHTLRITKFPIFDANGDICNVGSVSVDVTEQIKAREVTAAALREAEQASRTKSEFLATMSHEFRTPLNAILGFSEMLRSGILGPLGSEKYVDYANDIHDTGMHLLDLVSDILDISAIEAGKRTFEFEDVSVDELFDDCVKLLTPTARQGEITFTVNVEPDLPKLHVDKRSAVQIMNNLMSNAIKFSEAGGVISLAATRAENGIEIVISDTGIGIPAEKLSSITEPFTQGHDDPLLTHGGTGLGLAIVKALVEVLDGGLDIESTVGAGTTVRIVLPNAVHGRDKAAE